jgi:GAF domain-containing protein
MDKCFVSRLDAKSGSRTRNFISVPIIIGKIVRGGIIVTNKTTRSEDCSGYSRQRCKDKQQVLSTSFGPADEVLLGFIAANARRAIRHSITRSKSSSSIATIMSCQGPSILRSDIDSSLQQLVNRACEELEADSISVFAYSNSTKRLESTVSNGYKGLSFPIETGVAGTAFRTARVINIQETDSDERYNREVDAHMGSKTQNLLCAPILDSAGRPVGVMQALNKKGSVHFNGHDEILICEFCVELFSLLQDADFVSDYPLNCRSSAVDKFLSPLSAVKTMSCMASEVRRLIIEAVVCDFVGLYTFVPGDHTMGDHLINHNSTDTLMNKIPAANIPVQIYDALKDGARMELNVSPKSPRRNIFNNFLPDIAASHALIYPLYAGSESITGGVVENSKGDVMTCAMVLVVTRNNQRLTGFPAVAKDTLDLVVSVLESCIRTIFRKQLEETSINVLERKVLFANSTLATLKDYIILLGPGGKIIAWNKDLSNLLGPVGDDIGVTTTSIDSCSGTWLQSRHHVADVEQMQLGVGQEVGQHFSKLFKGSHCVELAVDIANATDVSRCEVEVCVRKSAMFTSLEYPAGVPIEYQLLSLDGDKADIVVLVIRLQQMSTCADGIPLSDHGRVRLKRNFSANILPFSLPENGDARELILAATSMLRSVGVRHCVPVTVQQELEGVTSTLNLLVNPESICTASPKNIKTLHRQGLFDADAVFPSDIFSWDFNVLDIKVKPVLLNVVDRLFESLQVLDVLGINPVTLNNYIRGIGDKYHDNPFHNFHHATCVTHFAYKLIQATNAVRYLSPQQLFGVMISAVVHDVDHPGNTNVFEINSQSYLALVYNDQSVLENHHCSTAFQLMRGASTDILGGLSTAVSAELRKTIVSCVMATDMSVHFQLVDETKKILSGGDYNFTEVQDQMFLCRLLVHSADLSNPVRPFHITQAWARRISAEFNLQVAMEQELKMPVLNFMMTPDDKALCKNETGFASFVVAPMWRSLTGLFPGLTPLVQQLDHNLSNWKSLLDQIMKEEAEREVAVS